jgi:hypothetical protein
VWSTREELNLPGTPYQSVAYPVSLAWVLVPSEGIEPSIPGYKAGGMPFTYNGGWCYGRDSNPQSTAYDAVALPFGHHS